MSKNNLILFLEQASQQILAGISINLERLKLPEELNPVIVDLTADDSVLDKSVQDLESKSEFELGNDFIFDMNSNDICMPDCHYKSTSSKTKNASFTELDTSSCFATDEYRKSDSDKKETDFEVCATKARNNKWLSDYQPATEHLQKLKTIVARTKEKLVGTRGRRRRPRKTGIIGSASVTKVVRKRGRPRKVALLPANQYVCMKSPYDTVLTITKVATKLGDIEKCEQHEKADEAPSETGSVENNVVLELAEKISETTAPVKNTAPVVLEAVGLLKKSVDLCGLKKLLVHQSNNVSLNDASQENTEKIPVTHEKNFNCTKQCKSDLQTMNDEKIITERDFAESDKLPPLSTIKMHKEVPVKVHQEVSVIVKSETVRPETFIPVKTTANAHHDEFQAVSSSEAKLSSIEKDCSINIADPTANVQQSNSSTHNSTPAVQESNLCARRPVDDSTAGCAVENTSKIGKIRVKKDELLQDHPVQIINFLLKCRNLLVCAVHFSLEDKFSETSILPKFKTDKLLFLQEFEKCLDQLNNNEMYLMKFALALPAIIGSVMDALLPSSYTLKNIIIELKNITMNMVTYSKKLKLENADIHYDKCILDRCQKLSPKKQYKKRKSTAETVSRQEQLNRNELPVLPEMQQPIKQNVAVIPIQSPQQQSNFSYNIKPNNQQNTNPYCLQNDFHGFEKQPTSMVQANKSCNSAIPSHCQQMWSTVPYTPQTGCMISEPLSKLQMLYNEKIFYPSNTNIQKNKYMSRQYTQLPSTYTQFHSSNYQQNCYLQPPLLSTNHYKQL